MYANRQEFLPLPSFKPVFEDVVVSLTSYGERIQHIIPTLLTLEEQTKKPSKIVLYIAHEDIDSVPDVVRDMVEVHECDDTRSHKKFNALWEYPDAYVITADDDLLYSPKWLETLFRASQIDRRAVVAHNTFIMNDFSFGRPATRRDNSASLKGRTYMYVMSGAGVLIPPKTDLSELKTAFDFSPFCDEKPLSVLLRRKHIPVLATRINEKPYNTEAYKLPKGGLWEQHNQKGQDERWKECKEWLRWLDEREHDNRFK